jgi:drug/metabolite transporter (DMT)-like permease
MMSADLMITWQWLWIPATIFAASAQVIRNSLQKHLIRKLGVMGATQVRFTYGLPWAIVFLFLITFVTGERIPTLTPEFAFSVGWGALAQIAATAMMLAAMRTFSLAHVTAFTKTEPIQVAFFAWIFLSEKLTLLSLLAMIIAVVGVMMLSFKSHHVDTEHASHTSLKAIVWGILAGGAFALAAVGFRNGILALDNGSFLIRASCALVGALFIQTLVMVGYLIISHREALIGSFRVWQSSMLAGFMGALASQFWFIGFSLAPAAHVRTLGLIEMLFALGISVFIFKQYLHKREILGLIFMLAGLIVFGVSL